MFTEIFINVIPQAKRTKLLKTKKIEKENVQSVFCAAEKEYCHSQCKTSTPTYHVPDPPQVGGICE